MRFQLPSPWPGRRPGKLTKTWNLISMSLTWARQVVSKSEEPIPEEEYRDLKRIHPQLRFKPGAMKGGTEISIVFAKASPAISLASRSSLQHLSHLYCLAHVWGNPTFAILLFKKRVDNCKDPATLKQSPNCSRPDGSSVCNLLFSAKAIIKTWQIPALHKYCHSRKTPQSVLSSHLQCKNLKGNEKVWDILLTMVQQNLHTLVQARRKVKSSSNKPFLKCWTSRWTCPSKMSKPYRITSKRQEIPTAPDPTNIQDRYTYFCFFSLSPLLCWSWWHVFNTESKVNICQYLEGVHVPMNGLFKNPLGCFDWFTYLESLAARAECLPWERLRVLEILLLSALPSVRRVQNMSDALLDFSYLLVAVARLWQTYRVQPSQVCS